MHLRRLWLVGVILAAAWGWPASGDGGVVVLCNRTAAQIDFTLIQPDGSEQRHSLAARDVVPIPTADRVGIAFDAGGTMRRYLLRANSIQFFVTNGGQLDMLQVGLPGLDGSEALSAPRGAAMASVGVVPVKILVDDGEPMVQRLWEKRLRDRLQEASDIIARHCRVRFEVVAVGTWVSSNTITNFERSLREFESRVNPAPAQLAIGFTSKYQVVHGHTDMGGTRGPLRPHILLREWSQHVSKTERLEMLLHELGHFLGAVHSAEGNSAMRPLMGDKRSNARDFRVGFDPINTLVMYLLGEELRSRPVRSLAHLSPNTKAYLRSAYELIEETMPKDTSAPRYLELLDRFPGSERLRAGPKPVAAAGGSSGY
jgi:hypothetical protein